MPVTDTIDYRDVVLKTWNDLNAKLIDAVAAMPEEGFRFKAEPAMETAGWELRHVAFWNRYVTQTLLGESPDGSANTYAEQEFSSKESLLTLLRHTSHEAADAIAQQPTPLSPEVVHLITSFVAHTAEHYGHFTVALRLNGVVPPASR